MMHGPINFRLTNLGSIPGRSLGIFYGEIDTGKVSFSFLSHYQISSPSFTAFVQYVSIVVASLSGGMCHTFGTLGRKQKQDIFYTILFSV